MNRKPNKRCEVCNKPIYRNPNVEYEHITCSRKCRQKLIRNLYGKYVYCDYCGKKFYKKLSRVHPKNFCCDECYRNSTKPKLSNEEIITLHLDGMYDKDIALVADCSRVKITKVLNENGFINRRDKINDSSLRKRISKTNKGKRTGKENHNYKGTGTYTALARGLFNSISKQYMLKMNYTCEVCGRKGGNLNTHHIKPFYIIVEEFLELNKNIPIETFSKKILKYYDFVDEENLLLVCEECHKEIHYGDNPELIPYKWESATTIENTN